MKTLMKLSGLILFVFVLNTSNAAVTVPGVKMNDEVAIDCTTGCLVKTTRWNGELIPVIDLPEVEISSESSKSNLVSGYFDKGVLVFKAELPVVEINASRTNFNKMHASVQNGEVIGIVELPVIEITSDFPVNNLKLSSLTNGSYVPVVNLPVIEIFGDNSQRLITNVNYIEQASIFSINKSVDNKAFGFAALLKNSGTWNPVCADNAEWFYVNLKKCGINIDGNEVCEIVSQTRINTNALVNFSIRRFIYDNYVLILH